MTVAWASGRDASSRAKVRDLKLKFEWTEFYLNG